MALNIYKTTLAWKSLALNCQCLYHYQIFVMLIREDEDRIHLVSIFRSSRVVIIIVQMIVECSIPSSLPNQPTSFQ